MPTPTTYTYSLSNDFPGGAVNLTALQIAITESGIATVLTGISQNGDVITITFADALSPADRTTLDGNQTHPAGGLIASTPTAGFIDENARFVILGFLRGANMNTTTDQPIIIPTNRYIIRRVTVGNPSRAMLVAAGGIYTAKNKGGNAIVPAVQLYTTLTGPTKYIDCAMLAALSSTVQTKQQLYFSLTTPEITAGTMDIAIWGDDYSGLVS